MNLRQTERTKLTDEDIAERTLNRALDLAEPVLGPARENGGGPFGTSEWCFPCPLHSNGDPTSDGLILKIHRDFPNEIRWWCRKCHYAGVHWSAVVARLAEVGVPAEALPPGFGISAGTRSARTPTAPVRPRKRPSRSVLPLPDDDLIEAYALDPEEPTDEARLDYLLNERLWRLADIKRLEIGWQCPQFKRYMFPQRDENGLLVNARLWDPHAPKGKRWYHWGKGHGKNARMWPLAPLLAAPQGSHVYLCAGEPDAMAAMARGAIAVTGHGGEGTPLKPADVALLAGHRVHVIYDSDVTGRAGAKAVKKQLRAFGGCASVRSHDLFPRRDDGSDLTNWLRLDRELPR